MDEDRKKELQKEMERQLKELRKMAAKRSDSDRVIEAERTCLLLFHRKEDRIKAEEMAKKRKPRPVEDIIANGTPEEKAILVVADEDAKENGERTLTDKQAKEVRGTFDNDEDATVFYGYLNTYHSLQAYQLRLSYVCKVYQIAMAQLASLLNKWEHYDRDADFLSILYGSVVGTGGNSGMTFNFEGDRNNMKDADDYTPQQILDEYNKTVGNNEVVFRGDGADVVADIDIDGGLYSHIKEQAEETEAELTIVKSYIEAVEDFVEQNGFAILMPSSMQLTIANMKEERYAHSLVKNSSYFRSNMNKIIANGATPSEAMRHKAVIPDYNEVEADSSTKKYCAAGLQAYMRRVYDVQ